MWNSQKVLNIATILRIAKKAMNDVKQFEMQEYTETPKGSK